MLHIADLEGGRPDVASGRTTLTSSQVSPVTFRLASKSETLVLASACIAEESQALYRLQPVQCDLPLHLGPLVAVTPCVMHT
jgi:hypothetical protein